MRSSPDIIALLNWLATLPPSVWWHLGETGLWIQTNEVLPSAPPSVEGLSIRFLDPSGDLPAVQ